MDPLSIDSGAYTCIVTSDYGCCVTSSEINIMEKTQNIRETIPTFIKKPVPVVAMDASVASYCVRVSPVTAKVKWFICGREITDSSRGIIVSISRFSNNSFIYRYY